MPTPTLFVREPEDVAAGFSCFQQPVVETHYRIVALFFVPLCGSSPAKRVRSWLAGGRLRETDGNLTREISVRPAIPQHLG